MKKLVAIASAAALGLGLAACDSPSEEAAALMRLVAPRPVLYAYPRARASTSIAKQTFDRMRPIYEEFSCPDRTGFYDHDPGDEFNAELAATWFERWLIEEDDTDVLLWAPRE